MKGIDLEEIMKVYEAYGVDPNTELHNVQINNFSLPNSFCEKVELKSNTNTTVCIK